MTVKKCFVCLLSWGLSVNRGTGGKKSSNRGRRQRGSTSHHRSPNGPSSSVAGTSSMVSSADDALAAVLKYLPPGTRLVPVDGFSQSMPPISADMEVSLNTGSTFIQQLVEHKDALEAIVRQFINAAKQNDPKTRRVELDAFLAEHIDYIRENTDTFFTTISTYFSIQHNIPYDRISEVATEAAKSENKENEALQQKIAESEKLLLLGFEKVNVWNCFLEDILPQVLNPAYQESTIYQKVVNNLFGELQPAIGHMLERYMHNKLKTINAFDAYCYLNEKVSIFILFLKQYETSLKARLNGDKPNEQAIWHEVWGLLQTYQSIIAYLYAIGDKAHAQELKESAIEFKDYASQYVEHIENQAIREKYNQFFIQKQEILSSAVGLLPSGLPNTILNLFKLIETFYANDWKGTIVDDCAVNLEGIADTLQPTIDCLKDETTDLMIKQFQVRNALAYLGQYRRLPSEQKTHAIISVHLQLSLATLTFFKLLSNQTAHFMGDTLFALFKTIADDIAKDMKASHKKDIPAHSSAAKASSAVPLSPATQVKRNPSVIMPATFDSNFGLTDEEVDAMADAITNYLGLEDDDPATLSAPLAKETIHLAAEAASSSSASDPDSGSDTDETKNVDKDIQSEQLAHAKASHLREQDARLEEAQAKEDAEIAELTTRFEASLVLLEKEHKRTLEEAVAKQKQKFKQQRERLNKKHERETTAKKAELDSASEQRLSQVKDSHQRELDRIEQEHLEAIAALEASSESAISAEKKRLRESRQKQKATYASEYEAAAATQQRKQTQTLTQLDQKHKKALAKLKSEHEEKIASLKSTYAAQHQAQTAAHAQALEALQREHEASVAAFEVSLKEKETQSCERMRAEIERLTAALEEKRQAKQQALAQESSHIQAQLQEKHEAAVTELEASHEKLLASLLEMQATTDAALQDSHEQALERLRQRNALAQRKHERHDGESDSLLQTGVDTGASSSASSSSHPHGVAGLSPVARIDIPPEYEYILDNLNDAGIEYYLTGGWIRNRLLGLPQTNEEDFDIIVNTTTENLLQSLPSKLKERLKGNLVQPKKLTFGKLEFWCEKWESLAEFLKLKDFTINTFVRDHNGQVYDVLGVWSDLFSPYLNVPGDSATRFKDDPSLMLRQIRFIHQLPNKSIAPEDWEHIRRLFCQVTHLPIGIYLKNIEYLFVSAINHNILNFLIDNKLLTQLFPMLGNEDIRYLQEQNPALRAFLEQKLSEFGHPMQQHTNCYHVVSIFVLIPMLRAALSNQEIDLQDFLNHVLNTFRENYTATFTEGEFQKLYKTSVSLIFDQVQQMKATNGTTYQQKFDGLYAQYHQFQRVYFPAQSAVVSSLSSESSAISMLADSPTPAEAALKSKTGASLTTQFDQKKQSSGRGRGKARGGKTPNTSARTSTTTAEATASYAAVASTSQRDTLSSRVRGNGRAQAKKK